MTLRSRIGLIRLRRDIAAVFDGRAPIAGLVDRARASAGHRKVLVREVEAHAARASDLPTFQRAVSILTPLDATSAIARLGAKVKAAQPGLIYPHLQDIAMGHRVGKAVVAAVTCDDLADADLNLLYQGVFGSLDAEHLTLVLDFLRDNGDRSVVPVRPEPARATQLVELFRSASAARAAEIGAWAQTPEEQLFAFRTAITLRDAAMIEHLTPTIAMEDLTRLQRGRVALVLWKGGTEEAAIPFARSVGPEGRMGDTMRAILDEYESFDFIDSGWRPGPRRETPLYTPTPRSILHVLHNSLPYRTRGSANRTQGLLAGLAANGYLSVGINPPGFPYEDVPADQAGSIKEQHEVGPVRYHNLLNGGEVIARSRVGAFLETYTPGIVERAEREKAALIHAASNGQTGLAGIAAARQIGVPSIYEVRGLNEEGRRSLDEHFGHTRQYALARHIENLAAHEADRVIAITEGLRTVLVERGVDANKITVIPNGVDTERFRPLERDNTLAEELGLQGKLVIGYVGTLNWYEGHDLLFEAVRRLKPRHPEMRVLLVGDGLEYKNLVARRHELGLDDTVVMTGRIPFEQVESYYSLIDIAPITRASSPLTESVSPLKPFEAMAMGKTVISSDVAVMKDVINGDNGLLYAKDDADSLESVLDRVLLDEGLRAQLGASGRSWVVAERDWRALAARVTRLYAELGVD